MSNRPRRWSLEDEPSGEDLAVVAAGVRQVGREAAAGGDARPIACFLREDGRIVAGACGRTEFDRLFVDYLWVAEDLRGSGLGSEALERLERAARERGCADALIETLNDRVAALYRRLGYVGIAVMERYVGPFNKHVLLKRLGGADPAVRTAAPDDESAIREAITAAFGETQGEEIADLVADLLADPSAQPLLSLVATEAGRVVGHVLFTGVRLDPAGPGVAASILAPLAVHPECQARGVGGALVSEGLERLRAAGMGRVFVLGDPRYYGRFGFRPAGARGFDAPYAIPREHADAWMVLALGSGSDEAPGGTVICADALMDPRHWLE